MPTRDGPVPGGPVTLISPPRPCAIWSTPGRVRVRAVLAEARRCSRRRAEGSRAQSVSGSMRSRCFTAGRKFSTRTSARSTRRSSTAWPSSVARSTIDGALVAVEVGAVGTAERTRSPPLGGHTCTHVGAEVGELAHARGSRPRHGEVDHADAGERTVFHAVTGGDRRDAGDHHDEAEHHVRDGARDRRLREHALLRSGSPGCGPGCPAGRGRRWWRRRGRRREAGGAAPRGWRRTARRRPR